MHKNSWADPTVEKVRHIREEPAPESGYEGNTKVQKSFRFDGLGFPILLLDVPMLKVRGTWTPDIDYNELRAGVFEGMTLSPCRLTGNEIKFIRQYFRMTWSRSFKGWTNLRSIVCDGQIYASSSLHLMSARPGVRSCYYTGHVDRFFGF